MDLYDFVVMVIRWYKNCVAKQGEMMNEHRWWNFVQDMKLYEFVWHSFVMRSFFGLGKIKERRRRQEEENELLDCDIYQ